MRKQKLISGFTLVELIITMSILGILSVIGFISYSGYISGVRDTNRVSQLESISNGLELYKIKYSLPYPDNYVEVISNGEIIAYQGYAGKQVLEQIEYNSEGVDPKTDEYFSYYLTRDKKNYQLMAFLEEENEYHTAILNFGNQVNAVDYSIQFPIVYGEKLGILTDDSNTPIQKISDIISAGEIDLGGTNSGTLYIAHIDNSKIYSFTGNILEDKLYSLSKPGLYSTPDNCPEGFIGVPGSKEFNQNGFCIAKYEMSYAGLTDTDNSGDWNTYSYLDNGDGGNVISEKNNSPIAEITQIEAINECTAIGKGYHLITNNEWMTIARNIELEDINWSSGIAGNGFIFNGISNDTNMGCSGTGVNFLPSTTAYATVTGADVCNQRNKLTLSNGQEIWDFSGNIQEHTNKANTIDGSGYDTGTNIDLLATNNDWGEWSSASSLNTLLYGPLIGIDNTNGVGKIYQADGTIFIRGATAADSTTAGIYSILLNYDITTRHNSVGFRCAKTK